MDPTPLSLVAVILAGGCTALWSLWWGTGTHRVAVIGLVVAPLLAVSITPALLAVVMLAEGNGLSWILQTSAVGLLWLSVAGVIACPCGAVAAVVGFGIGQWLFPIGSIRESGESLASLSYRVKCPMNLVKAVVTVSTCTLIFAALGCGIGFALGTCTPEYYRQLNRNGQRPEFNPVSMGIGLGASQGAVGGAVIGLALVVIVAWYDLKRLTQQGSVRRAQQDYSADQAVERPASVQSIRKGPC